MKHESAEKYLGDQISPGGLAVSVQGQLENTWVTVLQTIYEIKTVVDDCKSITWEMMVLLYFLNNFAVGPRHMALL